VTRAVTPAVRLWTCAVHDPVFRFGGWACVWRAGGQPGGLAGGERNTTPGRMALAGLAAGLGALGRAGAGTPAAAIRIETNSAELLVFAPVLAGLGAPGGAAPSGPGAPDQDLDLWAGIIAGARGRALTLTRDLGGPDTLIAFTTAWAQFGMERARARGAFSAPIPRTNLARAPWPADAGP
jgi:hypothetical protein